MKTIHPLLYALHDHGPRTGARLVALRRLATRRQDGGGVVGLDDPADSAFAPVVGP